MQGMSHNADNEYLKLLYFLLHCYLDPFVTPLLVFSAHILSAFRLQARSGSVCHSLCDCAVSTTIWSQGVFHLRCFFEKKTGKLTHQNIPQIWEKFSSDYKGSICLLTRLSSAVAFLHIFKDFLRSLPEKTIIPLKIPTLFLSEK